MPHWSDYSIRGWLSFLAFMHIGLALRSFFDSTFLYEKVFSQQKDISKDPILVRYFGAFSVGQAFILLQAAINLYVLPVQVIAMFFILVFVVLVLVESLYYQTLDFYGGTLLPCTMSIISFVWLTLFHYIWKPWLQYAIVEDYTLKTLLHEGKRKCKAAANSSNYAAGPTGRNADQYYRLGEIHMLKQSSTKTHSD